MTTIDVRPFTSVFSGLVENGESPEYFYLTGYEGICVKTDRLQVCKSVISSVVPIDSELLLIGDNDACESWRDLCACLDINVTLLDGDAVELTDIESVLKANLRISHVMCTGRRGRRDLEEIGRLAHRMHRSFVVEVEENEVLRLRDVEELSIDFLISSPKDDRDVSLIVAKRAKLVQTEGNARSSQYDIYAMWQQEVGMRSSTLLPMY
ncbi:MAG: hypothetical protein HUJ96_10940 [Marinilabiliaceae bacterium]|nr:hypothetical protein [Marinilabiliaceae bacterium]